MKRGPREEGAHLTVARSVPSGEKSIARTPECRGGLMDRSGVAESVSQSTMKDPGPASAVATTLLSAVVASAVMALQCAWSMRILPEDGE